MPKPPELIFNLVQHQDLEVGNKFESVGSCSGGWALVVASFRVTRAAGVDRTSALDLRLSCQLQCRCARQSWTHLGERKPDRSV